MSPILILETINTIVTVIEWTTIIIRFLVRYFSRS